MGPLQRAYHKEDFINVSRAVRKYHLLQVCSLIGVSLCGYVPKRGVGEQECTGYNLSMCKRKQKLSVRKNIGLRDSICAKKDTVPETVLKEKQNKQTLLKCLILHKTSSWHISLLLPFPPDQIAPSHPRSTKCFEQSDRA